MFRRTPLGSERILEFSVIILNNQLVGLPAPVKGVFLQLSKTFIWEKHKKAAVNAAWIKTSDGTFEVFLSRCKASFNPRVTGKERCLSVKPKRKNDKVAIIDNTSSYPIVLKTIL